VKSAYSSAATSCSRGGAPCWQDVSGTRHPRAVSTRAGIEANGSISGPQARRCELFAEIDNDPTCIFWAETRLVDSRLWITRTLFRQSI
jgi:hypothetical protein